MNKFSDLLATDHDIEVRIGIQPVNDNGVPHCRAKINQVVLFDGYAQGRLDVSHKVNLHDNVMIEIAMFEKTYCAEKETALIIEYIFIDGLQVIPKLVHLVVQHNEKNYHVPSCYLGANGIWRLEITSPFYQWFHRATNQGWLLKPISPDLAFTAR